MTPYYERNGVTIYLGDCLQILPQLDITVDAIITDLPYGTTACKWDVVIPFELMWQQVKRLLKPRGAFVTTASQPFTSMLIMSNLKWFKYELIWDKTFGRQPQLANIQPMKRHENLLVFGDGKITYNPQKQQLEKPYKSSGAGNNAGTKNNHKLGLKKVAKEYTAKTPDSVLIYKPNSNSGISHPTQKPVALYQYLIRTYTNPGDTVLDFCFGSGTTGVACQNEGRRFIGIEQDEEYCKIAVERLSKPTLFSLPAATPTPPKQTTLF
jgi:site-specific DNA-methyltransferase (adenine-specific)